MVKESESCGAWSPRVKSGRCTFGLIFSFMVMSLLGFGSTGADAKNTGKIIISNEKSNTLTILGPDDEPLRTIETCARPRGMHFSRDRTKFFVGCADDSVIAIYSVDSLELVGRIRNVEEPETFDLHADGRRLFVSNEEDATATVFDVETGELLGEFETGEEPEGVLATSDGKLVFVASEAANLVHVIDVEEGRVIADIPVDTRPRRFALTPDEKELWVSAELAGIVNIIDVATLKLIADVAFLPTGFRKEQVTPVDLLITGDGSRAYVALGRANHVAVVDVARREVIDYLLVGKRAWGLALTYDEKKLYVTNGLSDDVSIIDTERLKVVIGFKIKMMTECIFTVEYSIIVDI